MNNERDIPNHRRRLLVLGGLLACGVLSSARSALATEHGIGAPDNNGGDMQLGADMHMDMHEHEHHHHHAMPQGISRSEALYEPPSVTLVRQDGTKVAFPQELDDGRPVLLDFIYTSCTTVCPVTSQIFSDLQQKLGKDLENTKMISISIDPEYDTPARLRDYAKKFHAEPQWQHYTGTQEASVAMQRAFDVYRGDKMQHFPVTFLRAGLGKPWLRLEGFATPDMLAREYRDLVKFG